MGRYRFATYAAGCALAAAILAIPASFASRWNTETGYSGGPAGDGLNCAAASCHNFIPGNGRVELLDAPKRYRPGAQYGLTIRITDPEQVGAGFAMSAEGAGWHEGTFVITDPANTQFPDFAVSSPYITHSRWGVDDSVASWNGNGGWYEYHVAWEAPEADAGPITFFVAGNAVNNSADEGGDRFYSTYATIRYAAGGDGDGDTDVDLLDFAVLQRCFSGEGVIDQDECASVDFDSDGSVALDDAGALTGVMDGPIAALPAGYALADAVRGGLLYDKWWVVAEVDAPIDDHPRWAMQDTNTRSGADTWRCKECHGWDYKGAAGAYGSGSHFTGFPGVFGATLSAQEAFGKIKIDHGFGDVGMTDADLWDVVKMTREGVIDTDMYIDETGAFRDTLVPDVDRYNSYCAPCHGSDGRDLNFGHDLNEVYVGTIANDNPWEFLHKVRYGHPASSMLGFELLLWDAQSAAEVGAYCVTLPTE